MSFHHWYILPDKIRQLIISRKVVCPYKRQSTKGTLHWYPVKKKKERCRLTAIGQNASILTSVTSSCKISALQPSMDPMLLAKTEKIEWAVKLKHWSLKARSRFKIIKQSRKALCVCSCFVISTQTAGNPNW